MNGHHALTQSDAQSSNTAHANGTATPALKKSGFKAKKATADPSEVPKLLAAKISQLESDQAGEKEEEAEIGKYNAVVLSEPVDVCCEGIGGAVRSAF
jgi:hypothetical protein